MQLEFEHHYQKKYLTMRWPERTTFRSADDVMAFRQQWMQALSSWHSPYKAVIDASNLRIEIEDTAEAKDEFKKSWQRAAKLLQGFFLKNAAFWGLHQSDLADLLPFPVLETEEQAFQHLHIRLQAVSKVAASFRDTIQFQNHFRQHCIELSFSDKAVLDDADKLNSLRSKLTNNLMHWHSAWNLLIDCSHFEVSQDQFEGFASMLRFFRGFFLKDVIGYSPASKGLEYPFPVYRSRHIAAAKLEAEGQFSADEANCQSRKSPT